MYDFDWHKAHGEKTSSSAAAALRALHAMVPFASALDVGCGDGRWLAEAKALGADIAGVDGPWTQLDRMVIPGAALTIHDLSGPFDLGRRFDLAISLEVAEHVAAEHAETFVDNLVRHADLVLFGAAIPYQGGFRHINERWQSYWAALFEAKGYRLFDPLRALLWNAEKVHYWYKQNMLVYVKAARADLAAQLEQAMAARRTPALPVDIVHPEKYEAIASYRQIAFKPLLRELPGQAAAKLRAIVARKT